MADALVRLKFDSKEYDAKIERARKGLLDFQDSLEKAGKSFKDADTEQVKFAQQLGNFQTVARTAKGQVAELTKAYTDLKMQYDKLSDADKNSDFGKGLAASLDTLKTRIKEGNAELKNIGQELGNTATASNGAGSALDALTSKFGISTKNLIGWGAAIGAAKAALDVAKDAFFASEASLDNWNRTVYSAQSAYQAFLTSINTGDISGFLTNIDTIVKAATEAYNAMDALSTQQAINNAPMQAQQAENQRFRAMLQTRRWISAADGRDSGGMKDGQLLTNAQLKVIERMLENGMKTLNSYTQKEIKATTNAIEALYKEQATRLGMTKQEFLAGTKNYDIFSKNLEGANAYRNIEAQKNYLRNLANSGQNLTADQATFLNQRNPYEQYKAWGVFKDDGDLFQRINQYINQRAGLESQYYGQLQQGYRAINRVEGISGRGGSGKGTTADKLTEGGIKLGKGFDGLTDATFGTFESMKSLREKLRAYQDALDSATTAAQEVAARQGIADVKWQMSDEGRMAAKLGWSKADLEQVHTEMQEAIGEMQPLEIKANVNFDKRNLDELTEGGNDVTKAMTAAGQAISAMGKAVQLIEDPTAKIIGLVAQAVASVAAAAGQAMAAKDTTSSGYAWIGAAATIAAEMATVISQIHSLTGYAQGGIIKGNSYSGDNLLASVGGEMIGLNAGELVLNKAQTANLANALTGDGQQAGGNSTPYLTGEILYLGLNNYLRRTGRGELITSRQ